MLYTSKPIGDRGTVPGIAGELDALKGDLSTVLVAARGALLDGLGSPAGARRVNRAEVLRRIDVYEDPDSQAALKDIGDGDLVRLTRESIRARSYAQSRGEWSPRTEPPPPPPPPAPVEPPMGFPAPQPSAFPQAQPAPSISPLGLPPIGQAPLQPVPASLPPTPMPEPVPSIDLSGPAPIG